jgi:hypothetical protein
VRHQQHLFRKGTRLLHLYRNYCSFASNLGTNKVYKTTIYAEENCLLRSKPLHEEFDPFTPYFSTKALLIHNLLTLFFALRAIIVQISHVVFHNGNIEIGFTVTAQFLNYIVI